MPSFSEMDVDTIWMDGEFVDWEDAQVHVLTHALHYGSGIFEGVRVYDTDNGPAIFRWDDHLQRFYESAKPYDLDIEFTPDELTDATVELIQRQDLGSCYIRPLAYYGYESLGVSPGDCPTDVAIAAWPWGAYLGDDALENGVDVMVSTWRKHASSQIPTNAKTTGLYVNSMLAGEEARRNGFTEAIVLNKEGNVAEGPGENIFLVRDGELFTPGLSESILDGITRDTVITLAEERGYTVHDDVSISRGELHTADELFFTGSAAEVTPIKQVDNVEIGSGTRGPVTEELQTAFFDLVEAGDREEWFHYV
ncbi:MULTISPECIES: branched-chain amino acid transaminase [Halobacterium]|uniref:Branched-chain-amino-acid aminotransferase n=4 Tax=Halobacterium salinarum TaxID=2242 RepID=Q9HNF8_HALSA|nr:MULTISPECIES: branched-chain amino acid transaminase [Halobacterium]AAG20262.1 branched-chain amino acid aminotransferase [Halobacterium salinarum NRC-1]MBB6089279.1 branched-chain amino acid aminotransferase [Halobacterium salinarum]MCF2165883.1 branched-chain amino acid transaminase [Halobacterium salinarum]MCF2167348.1 branched-chain amino acid transaminase [Halobacterium salinarum]MCF2207373.1 branched-chain amino acid transaminase [Halobacterium salinarum]